MHHCACRRTPNAESKQDGGEVSSRGALASGRAGQVAGSPHARTVCALVREVRLTPLPPDFQAGASRQPGLIGRDWIPVAILPSAGIWGVAGLGRAMSPHRGSLDALTTAAIAFYDCVSSPVNSLLPSLLPGRGSWSPARPARAGRIGAPVGADSRHCTV